jgi:hypothetical protein
MWGGCVVNGVATLGCIPKLYQYIIQGILGLIGTLAVILIIFAGIRFITASGDSKKVEEAKKAITYVIAGLLIILFSFFIINLIADITGVRCLKNFGIGNGLGGCN